MRAEIQRVWAREVLDSRGNPTVEVEVTLSGGSTGRAIVPSGASKGEHECLELRDGDKKRFAGKGVRKAVDAVRGELAKVLAGKSPESIAELDSILLKTEGTDQKTRLGANSLLGISLAFGRALAEQRKEPLYQVFSSELTSPRPLSLPVPLMNILNGGVHADNGLEIQEFMVVPHGFATFSDSLRAGVEIFHLLKSDLHEAHLSTAVGDEGGFAPHLGSNEKALELICRAVEKSGYRLGEQVSLALDVASASFFDRDSGTYRIGSGGKGDLSSEAMIAWYADLVERFPIVSIEDGLDENDWNGWKALTSRLGKKTQLVGDDLFVTQAPRVQKGIEMHAANAVLIKVNQVGTVTETLETMQAAWKAGFRNVVSHRSGETEDSTIAHLAVGTGCGQIKTGSLCRGERTAKYNELLRIEEALGTKALFAGSSTFR